MFADVVDHNLPQVEGPQCRAVFSLLNSQICALKFSDSRAKLVVAFECGRVSLLVLCILFFFNDRIGYCPLLLASFKKNSGSKCFFSGSGARNGFIMCSVPQILEPNYSVIVNGK